MSSDPGSDPDARDAPEPSQAEARPQLPTAPTSRDIDDGEPTADERTWALVGHALTFVEGGIVGPLVVYLVKREESEFVAFHALQSLYFGLLALAVIGPATLITCGAGAVLVFPYLIFEIIACVEANKGEWYELPIVGSWALRSHHP